MKLPSVIVIDKVEQACHWFQKMTGWTNYWWMSKAAWIITWTTIIGLMRAHFGFQSSWWTPSYLGAGPFWRFLGVLVVVVYGYDAYRGWKTKEERAFARVSLGIANPEKNSVVMHAWIIVNLLICWISFYMLALLFCMIFSACDPLPPCRGKVRELLRKKWLLQRNLKPVTERS